MFFEACSPPKSKDFYLLSINYSILKQLSRLECGLELSSMGMWEPKPETAFEESTLPSFLLLHAFGVAR